jgi:CHAT domain-containing protein
MKLTVGLLFIVSGFSVFGQKIPANPNNRDAKGLRQGKWTILFDNDWRAITDSSKVMYYRLIEFEDDKPVGMVRDYYLGGQIQFEGTLIADKPEEVLDPTKPIHYYMENGEENIGLGITEIAMEYNRLGNYEVALSFAVKAKDAFEKQFGKESSHYSEQLLRVANLNTQLGYYTKAESIFQEALDLQERLTGKDNELYGRMLMRAAGVRFQMGNNEKAEPMFQEARDILVRSLGKDNRIYSIVLNSLGNVNSSKGNYREAANFYRESLKVLEKINGPNRDYGVTMANYAGLVTRMGHYYEADSLYRLVISSLGRSSGKNHDNYAFCLNNWAYLKSVTKSNKKADSLYQAAIQLIEKNYGEANRFYPGMLSDLGTYYQSKKDLSKAEPLLLKASKITLQQIDNFFPSLSEFEKEAFYKSKKHIFENFNAFAMERAQQELGILGEMYNNQLATKGLLLNSASKWKQRIRSSGDKKLFGLYTEWENNQYKLARLYKEGAADDRNAIDSLEKIANRQEKDLSKRSEMFASLADRKKSTWEEIKTKLKPNEAAIEMIRVKKFGVMATVTDSSDRKLPEYQLYGLTDTIYYAALIVTANSTTPEMVLLKNGNDLEKRFIKYYSNSIKGQLEDMQSFNQFWKPVGDRLARLVRHKQPHIYFSADGVYNQLNLSTLFNPQTKKYLSDELNISLVTSTKDLLVPAREEAFNNLAYLFGHPNYGASLEGRKALVKKDHQNQPVYYALALEEKGSLEELPGTKKEVETIGDLMLAKSWQPEVLTGDQALEETIKDCFKPRVMHIATHGYFLGDTTGTQNSLLQSGLMLTGAAHAMQGNTDEKLEDGILTAYEAMNLNLDNTDLVVLSACETGLGIISHGEGVYGLQRAFKVAGAKTIIMSLWKVNDEATQELMTAFYENWLSTQNKRTAFNYAQQKLKAKYKSPYYWGAFVMVGD